MTACPQRTRLRRSRASPGKRSDRRRHTRDCRIGIGFRSRCRPSRNNRSCRAALDHAELAEAAVGRVSWSVVLLICGVLTYVGVLEEMGTIDYVGEAITQVGAPAFAALLISYIGAIVSAFASSTGMLAATIPLAVPSAKMLSATGAKYGGRHLHHRRRRQPAVDQRGPFVLPTPGTLIGTCSSATYLPTVLSWQSWLPRWPGLSSWCRGLLIEDAATCCRVCPPPQLCGPGSPASQVPDRAVDQISRPALYQPRLQLLEAA